MVGLKKEMPIKRQASRMVKKISSTITREEEPKASVKPLDFIITSCIVLVFFLCPIFFTGLVAQGTGFEKMILFYFLTLLGVVAWVTKGVVRGELNLKRTPLDLPILALLVIFAISTFLGVSIKDSLIGPYGGYAKSFLATVVFVLFYYLVVNNINFKKIKAIFWVLLTSSLLVAIYAILQLFGIFVIPIPATHTNTFNTIGGMSGLTMFLVSMLPLFIVGTAQVSNINKKLKSKFLAFILKFILGIGALAVVVALTTLNSFTFWPVAVVGVVIVLMFFLAKIIPITNSNLLLPLGAFLILIVLLVLGKFNFVDLKLPTEVNLSRNISWEIAKNSLKENPLLGSGPATFYYDFSKFKGGGFNSSPLWNIRFDSASGSLFEMLATVGPLGTLGVVVIALISLSLCFISLIKSKAQELSSVVLALFASFVSMLIFAMLFSFSNTLILMVMLVSTLTVSSAILIYPEKFRVCKLSFRASPKYALGLAAVFLGVSAGVVVLFTMGIKMYTADMYAQQSLSASGLEEKIVKLKKATILFPHQDSYYADLSKYYMAMANDEVSKGGNQDAIGGYLSMAIESGKEALKISPKKASNNEALALVYENASFYTRGSLEWAEDLYKKLSELEPDNPVPHLRLALINMSRANAEESEEEKKYYVNEAINEYDRAIEKKGDLGSAYYGKAISYEQLGDLDKSIGDLKNAVIFSRDNLDYKFELGRLYFNRGTSRADLSQTASEDVIEDEISDEEGGGDELSVEVSAQSGVIVKNEDLKMAEQAFLSVVQANPRHANAIYSLALIYQKTGDKKNAELAVKALLNIVTDEKAINAIKQQFKGLY